MGRSSKLKRLRKLAMTMPPETDYAVKVERMTGKQIIDQDKRMKKALKTGNVEAVKEYVIGVTERYEKRMEENQKKGDEQA